jgi:hypothetical protein
MSACLSEIYFKLFAVPFCHLNFLRVVEFVVLKIMW